MKKRLWLKLLQIFGLILLLGQAYAKETRDNILCDSYFNQFSFKPVNNYDWYSITDGQPFEEVVQSVSTKPYCINIRAGRKKSERNVKWVKEKLADIGVSWDERFVTGTKYYNDLLPKELNFAIMGTLSFIWNDTSLICDNVIIAQGHHNMGDDNFWIFNNNTDRPHTLKCIDQARKKKVYMNLFTGAYQNGSERVGFSLDTVAAE